MNRLIRLNEDIIKKIEALADKYCLLLKNRQKEESVKMSAIIQFYSDLYKSADKNNEKELQSVLNELIANEK